MLFRSDYYGLRAVFEPALDWNAWKTPNARRVSLYTEADRQAAAALESEAATIVKQRAERQSQYMQAALDQELEKFEAPLRSQLRDAYQTPGNQRTAEHKRLLSAHPSVNITPGNLYQYIPDSKPKLAEYDKQIKEIRSKKPVEEFLRALVEPPGHVPETKLFHRGDHEQPKQAVLPATLSVVNASGQSVPLPVNDDAMASTGRRLAFASWLTTLDNPLFPRVLVNRVWMHHFGKGLVPTPADFGKLGAPPENLALLDWLACEFIEQGWSLKRLHRLIMTSAVYRQRVGTRRTLRRLEAEAIRDRMLAAAGTLDETVLGRPIPIKADDTGQTVVDGEQSRRSLYVQVRRSRPVAMLESFDAPVMETNCENRSESTVSTQSLMLLNGQFVLHCAGKLADRATIDAPWSPPEGAGALSEESRKLLRTLALAVSSRWRYGYGTYDAKNNRTTSFAPLKHWSGSQWQASATLPDPAIGWALLNASGGHPDSKQRSVIRRWIAPSDGQVSISGTLGHASPHGDGVLGRVISSRTGQAAEWVAKHQQTATAVPRLDVLKGDAIDFLVECRENFTSDSFSWPVTLMIDGQTHSSAEQFEGPSETAEAIGMQIVRAWQLAYGRQPDSEEWTLAIEFIARQLQTMRETPTAVPAGRSKVRQAMTNLCQSLLSSNEFLYVE